MSLSHAMMTALLGTMAPGAASSAPVRLSDQQVEQVLAEAAAKREAAERAVVADGRKIHGEMGVSVGTGGYRAAFGTAVVPLGGESAAILSFSTETSRDRRVVHEGDQRRGRAPR